MKPVHFISGCFDGFHPGHAYILTLARQNDCHLVVAINSDDYIRRKKHREPIDDLDTRIRKVQRFADDVLSFDEDTPLSLIKTLMPDLILVGSDYREQDVTGFGLVPVQIIERQGNFSTTNSRINK